MLRATIVRLFHCRPLRPAYDATLRDTLLPDLRSRPGVRQVWAGRQGPDEMGRRLVASLWTSLDEMVREMGADLERDFRFHPDHLAETTDRALEVLPILLALPAEEPLQTGVLRLARGVLQEMDLARYTDLVRNGVDQDRQAGFGPTALVLAGAGERAFVTVSTWLDWATIEAATGASIGDPIRTKRLAGMERFHAEHFELLPQPEERAGGTG